MVGFKSDPLKLTRREQEVLDCLMDGLTYKQTAEKLCLSRYTMNTYRASIFQKKDVHSLTELIVKEYKKKLKEVTDGNN